MRNWIRPLVLSLAVTVWACAQTAYSQEPAPGEEEVVEGSALVDEPSPDAMDPGEYVEEPIARTMPVAFAIDFPMGRSVWYFQADGMALRRENSFGRSFATLGRTTWTENENEDYTDPPAEGETDTRMEYQQHPFLWSGSTSFTTSLTLDDLDMSRFQAGGRILLGRTLGPNTGFEVSYFDLADWRASAVVTDESPFIAAIASKYSDGNGEVDPSVTLPGSLFSPMSGYGDWLDRTNIAGGLPFDYSDMAFDGNNLAEITYASSLDNLEWNLRHWIVRVPGYTQVSLILGGRYMNVNESFYYRTVRDSYDVDGDGPLPVDAGATTSVTTDTRNPMIGAQVGGTYEVCVRPGWWLDCELKGALLSNGAAQETMYVHTGDDDYAGTNMGRAERSGVASAIDATFATRFSVSRRVAVHLSYQLLYVSGLALAPDNLSTDPTVLLDGPATVVTNGDILYHGVHLGVTCAW